MSAESTPQDLRNVKQGQIGLSTPTNKPRRIGGSLPLGRFTPVHFVKSLIC